MVSAKQKKQLLGLLLLAIAGFMALSLIPVSWLGADAAGAFAGGNLMGAFGRWSSRAGWWLLGIATPLVPVLVGIGGAASFGWLSRDAAIGWVVAVAGYIVTVPCAAALLTPDLAPGAAILPEFAGGRLGAVLSVPLVALLGWVGAALTVGIVALALPAFTIGWNPAAQLWALAVRGGRVGLARGRSALAAMGEWWLSAFELRRPEIDSATSPQPAPAEAPSTALVSPDPPVETVGTPEPEPPRERSRGLRWRRTQETSTPVLDDPGDPHATDRPPATLLSPPPPRDARLSEDELDRLGQVLVDTLRTFKVEGTIVGRTTGPVVTQFEVVPAPGIKVNRIAALDADLALALKAASVRIVAPIPGKGAVGVEVPNPAAEVVYLREILESPAFQRSQGALPLALGKDLHGRPYVADLARMPHLLIAGATGSGKSVCINTLITSLIYRHSPQTLRLLMIDPKMVELSMYADLPHLRHPVVTDPKDAATVLKWAVIEMERRYELLSHNGARSLSEFNRRAAEGQPLRRVDPPTFTDGTVDDAYTDGPLPYIVVVVDELADLMLSVQAEIEKPLAQLAQKARAIGIHLIVATQRPSVNVITGLIKANFPCRIAFRVSSKVDSRTILDQNGADALLGNGDMLFLPPGRSDPVRIQGVFLSTEDTERLMAWYRERAKAEAVLEDDILEVVRSREAQESGDELGDDIGEERDPLFRQAAEVCIQFQQGSTSLLQRRLRIGYGRAARIIDQLHHAGVLGPPDGSRPREVLVGLDALD